MKKGLRYTFFYNQDVEIKIKRGELKLFNSNYDLINIYG